jgi:hypothetical protein
LSLPPKPSNGLGASFLNGIGFELQKHGER